MAVKMKSGALLTQGSDRWYVTDGANSVGPVKLELLTRGIEGGRVPLDSFVRHEAWKVWRPLAEFTDFVEESRVAVGGGQALSRDDRAHARVADEPLPQFPLSDRGHRGETPTVGVANAVGSRAPSLVTFAFDEGVPSRTSSSSMPPPPSSLEVAIVAPAWSADDDSPSNSSRGGIEGWGMAPDASNDLVGEDLLGDDQLELRAIFPRQSTGVPPAPLEVGPTDDIPDSAGGDRGFWNARPAESTDALPDDDLRGASDLSDALLLLLGGAVRRTNAEAALLHRMGDHGAIVVCAHGALAGVEGEPSPLGLHTSFVDPIVVAAASGNIVLAEPSPGSAGSAMLRRLSPPGLLEALEATGPHLLLPGEPAVACRPIVAALMLPIIVRGRLFGFLELGKSTPFTARDISKADDLVRAFTRLAVDGGLAI